MRKTVTLLLCLSAILVSCATNKVQMSESEYHIVGQDVAFMEVEFAERELPVIPLIDAGIYSASAKSVHGELKSIEQRKQLEITAYYEAGITELLGQDVQTVPNSLNTINAGLIVEPDEDTKTYVRSIISEADASYLIIPTIQVRTVKAAIFGVNGVSHLESHLYIFDKNGEPVADGFFRTKDMNTRAKDLKVYESLIDQYKPISDELLGLMIH